MMRRVFAVMGMYPVGYYDLSTAGVPVHSTAFRPVGDASLKRNPFRVFTSLLRLDLIADEALRDEADRGARKRADLHRRRHRISPKRRSAMVASTRPMPSASSPRCLETFRWHDKANVERGHVRPPARRAPSDRRRRLVQGTAHQSPDAAHAGHRRRSGAHARIRHRARRRSIEGPPTRKCPILLRQTSFKALEEPVSFRPKMASWQDGLAHRPLRRDRAARHCADPEGPGALRRPAQRDSRKIVRPAADGSNAAEYETALAEAFSAFPDDWDGIRADGLGYFAYSLTAKGRKAQGRSHRRVSTA